MKLTIGWTSILAAVLVLGYAADGNAQHGEAHDGYYPLGYMGDTWTGQVSAIDIARREITLTATSKKGTETFVVYLPEKVPGKSSELKMTDFAVGQNLRFYYIPKTVKVDGQKVKRNEIFRVESVSSDRR